MVLWGNIIESVLEANFQNVAQLVAKEVEIWNQMSLLQN